MIIFTSVCVCLCVRVRVRVFVPVCVSIYTFIYQFIHTNKPTHVSCFIYKCVCLCLYQHIHTYTPFCTVHICKYNCTILTANEKHRYACFVKSIVCIMLGLGKVMVF